MAETMSKIADMSILAVFARESYFTIFEKKIAL